jgi:hypothetical protein
VQPEPRRIEVRERGVIPNQFSIERSNAWSKVSSLTALVGAQATIGLHAYPAAAGHAPGDGDVGPRRVGVDGRSSRAWATLSRMLGGGGERRVPIEEAHRDRKFGLVVQLAREHAASHGRKGRAQLGNRS